MEPDLIAVGDAMVDVSVASEALRRGGDVHGEVRLRPGGSALNAAVWAADAGGRVRLYGRVGDDLAGGLLRRALEARGVEAALTVDPDARTGAMLVVRQSGERSMVADRGANARLRPEHLPKRLVAGAVLVSGYLLFDPGSRLAAEAALERAEASLVAVDAASWPLIEEYGAEAFLGSIDRASMVLANAREAEALSGLDDPEEAARALAGRHGRAAVKLGERGAIMVERGNLIRAPAPAVQVVDTTGAGDAFDGVLLASLATGAGPETALRSACAAGARVAASPDLWPER